MWKSHYSLDACQKVCREFKVGLKYSVCLFKSLPGERMQWRVKIRECVSSEPFTTGHWCLFPQRQTRLCVRVCVRVCVRLLWSPHGRTASEPQWHAAHRATHFLSSKHAALEETSETCFDACDWCSTCTALAACLDIASHRVHRDHAPLMCNTSFGKSISRLQSL